MNGYQQLADNVFRWEKRGRGGLIYPRPVGLEPPFVPFPGHRVTFEGPPDDGRRHTIISKFTDRMFRALQAPQPTRKAPELQEREPDWREEEEEVREVKLLLPQDLTVTQETMKQFLAAISQSDSPMTVELIGDESGVHFQMTAQDSDFEPLATQLEIHFPGIARQEMDSALLMMWGNPEDDSERAVVEFGLEKPFMLSLGEPGKSDPFVGLAGALSALEEDEMGAYQVIFTPLLEPWADQAMACLTKEDGKPFFSDGAAWVKAAHEKVSQPLYGVVVRLAARSWDLERSWQIIRQLAAPLRLFASQWGNSLTPLANDEYDEVEHNWDVYLRRSRRCGMILSLDELTGLIRFPTAALKSSRFHRLDEGTRGAKTSGPSKGGALLGFNEHVGAEQEVWLTPEERMRHVHMIGASGSGKTTLMFNLIQQDIENGAGFALLDPHGDLVNRVMEIIPPSRWDDVILVDPSDEQFIVPFNFLSAHHDFEKTLLASDLVAVFRAQSTSWGDQMNLVFGNAIRAFLESTEGGTLSDVRRFLLDPKYREQFLKTVTDPDVVLYWKLGFPQLGGNKSIGPILTRLETFLSPKPIRYMVTQRENRLDFADMMDRGKIFLARLPQGQMGKENSNLLGSLLVAKLQQMAMSRQRLDVSGRRPFYVYVDEFQNFICPSMAEILSGARKYGMGFVLAHQDLRQLDRDKEVASAVLSNAYTRVVFRVSDSDARTLSEGFAHFPSGELQNLPVGHAICRIGQSDNDFNLAVPLPDAADQDEAAQNRLGVIESSRARVAIPRAEVERSHPDVSTATEKTAADPLVPAPEAPSKREEIPTPPIGSDDGIAPATARIPDHENPKSKSPSRPTSMESPYGRGGPTHKALQRRLIEAANAQGLKAFPEFDVLDGQYRLDASIEGTNWKLACEIIVTSRLDKEIKTLKECQKCGYQSALLVCVDGDKLAVAQARCERELPEFPIHCLLPAQLNSYLKMVARTAEASEAGEPKLERVANHDLARRSPKLSARERQRIEENALQAIAIAIRDQTDEP